MFFRFFGFSTFYHSLVSSYMYVPSSMCKVHGLWNTFNSIHTNKPWSCIYVLAWLRGFRPMHIYVPHNLRICAISRLHGAFSESWDCVPISRLHNTRAQSRDRVICMRNLWISTLPVCLKVSVCCDCVAIRMEDSLDNRRLQSQDRATIVRNLEIGTQSQVSENAQCNLRILRMRNAILRFRETYTLK